MTEQEPGEFPSEVWLANLKARFGVDENHPRIARLLELNQKSCAVGLTADEMWDLQRQSELLDDELVPIWNAAHPDKIIHLPKRGPTEKWFAALKAHLIANNNPKVLRILEIRSRQQAGTSSAEETDESNRLFIELRYEDFMKRLSKPFETPK
jgi:hypothetical protein